MERKMSWFAAKKKYVIPSEILLEKADENVRNTPDMWKLAKYEFQNVFIYDAMQLGYPKHELINEGILQLIAFTVDPYVLWRWNGTPWKKESHPDSFKKIGEEKFPIPLNTSFQGIPAAKIKGELYSIPSSLLAKLDKEKQNGVQFIRRREKLVIPYRLKGDEGTLRVDFIKAWMYVGVPSFWEPHLDAGYLFSPVNRYAPKHNGVMNLGPYYYFTKPEYYDVQSS